MSNLRWALDLLDEREEMAHWRRPRPQREPKAASAGTGGLEPRADWIFWFHQAGLVFGSDARKPREQRPGYILRVLDEDRSAIVAPLTTQPHAASASFLQLPSDSEQGVFWFRDHGKQCFLWREAERVKLDFCARLALAKVDMPTAARVRDFIAGQS